MFEKNPYDFSEDLDLSKLSEWSTLVTEFLTVRRSHNILTYPLFVQKEAKETLCDPSKRALYDKWRNSGISMGYKQWLGMKDHVQQSMHWSKPNTKDRMLEDDAKVRL